MKRKVNLSALKTIMKPLLNNVEKNIKNIENYHNADDKATLKNKILESNRNISSVLSQFGFREISTTLELLNILIQNGKDFETVLITYKTIYKICNEIINKDIKVVDLSKVFLKNYISIVEQIGVEKNVAISKWISTDFEFREDVSDVDRISYMDGIVIYNDQKANVVSSIETPINKIISQLEVIAVNCKVSNEYLIECKENFKKLINLRISKNITIFSFMSILWLECIVNNALLSEKEIKNTIEVIKSELFNIIDLVKDLVGGDKTSSIKLLDEQANITIMLSIIESGKINQLSDVEEYKEVNATFKISEVISEVDKIKSLLDSGNNFQLEDVKVSHVNNTEVKNKIDRLVAELKAYNKDFGELGGINCDVIKENVLYLKNEFEERSSIVGAYFDNIVNYINTVKKVEDAPDELITWLSINVCCIKDLEQDLIEMREDSIKEIEDMCKTLMDKTNAIILNIENGNKEFVILNEDVPVRGAQLKLNKKKKLFGDLFKVLGVEFAKIEEYINDLIKLGLNNAENFSEEKDEDVFKENIKELEKINKIIYNLGIHEIKPLLDETIKCLQRMFKAGVVSIEQEERETIMFYAGAASLFIKRFAENNFESAELIINRAIQRHNNSVSDDNKINFISLDGMFVAGQDDAITSNTVLNTTTNNLDSNLPRNNEIEDTAKQQETIPVQDVVNVATEDMHKEEKDLLEKEINEERNFTKNNLEAEKQNMNNALIQENNIKNQQSQDVQIMFRETNTVENAEGVEDMCYELLENMEELESSISNYEEEQTESNLTNIKRIFHTIKGSGRQVGLTYVPEVAWLIEQTFKLVLEGHRLELSKEEVIDISNKALESFKDWNEELSNKNMELDIDMAEWIQYMYQFNKQLKSEIINIKDYVSDNKQVNMAVENKEKEAMPLNDKQNTVIASLDDEINKYKNFSKIAGKGPDDEVSAQEDNKNKPIVDDNIQDDQQTITSNDESDIFDLEKIEPSWLDIDAFKAFQEDARRTFIDRQHNELDEDEKLFQDSFQKDLHLLTGAIGHFELHGIKNSIAYLERLQTFATGRNITATMNKSFFEKEELSAYQTIFDNVLNFVDQVKELDLSGNKKEIEETLSNLNKGMQSDLDNFKEGLISFKNRLASHRETKKETVSNQVVNDENKNKDDKSHVEDSQKTVEQDHIKAEPLNQIGTSIGQGDLEKLLNIMLSKNQEYLEKTLENKLSSINTFNDKIERLSRKVDEISHSVDQIEALEKRVDKLSDIIKQYNNGSVAANLNVEGIKETIDGVAKQLEDIQESVVKSESRTRGGLKILKKELDTISSSIKDLTEGNKESKGLLGFLRKK